MTAVTIELDREDLRATIAETLDLELGDVTDEAHFVDDLAVDSLMALEVVVVLEKKYGVRLLESELQRIICLDEAYTVVADKLAESIG